MSDINNIITGHTHQTGVSSQSAHLAILKNVYLWMTFALMISGGVAVLIAQNPQILALLFANTFSILLVFAVQFGIVWFISSRINSLSITSATLLFILYAIITGATLSTLFLAFTSESISSVFFMTAGTFAAMSIYGYTTKRDMSTIGSYLFMGVIGLIIASVVNLFMHSETLYWIISYIGVAVFVALTAYDTQKVKEMAMQHAYAGEEIGQKVALMGALTLYLDFINLFIYLLRIFGRRK